MSKLDKQCNGDFPTFSFTKHSKGKLPVVDVPFRIILLEPGNTFTGSGLKELGSLKNMALLSIINEQVTTM